MIAYQYGAYDDEGRVGEEKFFFDADKAIAHLWSQIKDTKANVEIEPVSGNMILKVEYWYTLHFVQRIEICE